MASRRLDDRLGHAQVISIPPPEKNKSPARLAGLQMVMVGVAGIEPATR